MAIDLELYNELTEIIKDSDNCPRLSAWEINFLADIKERFNRFKADVILSEKQIATIRRIAQIKIYILLRE